MTLIISYSAHCANHHDDQTREIVVKIGFRNHYTMFYSSIQDCEKAFDRVVKRIYGKVYYRISRLVIISSRYDYRGCPDIYLL